MNYPAPTTMHHTREQLDAALAQSSATRCMESEAAARRQRILLKLGTLWDAHPQDSLAELLDNAIMGYTACDNPLSWASRDETIEEGLDSALKAEGLSISGGWLS